MASIPFENAHSAAANTAPAGSNSVKALFELSHMTLFVNFKEGVLVCGTWPQFKVDIKTDFCLSLGPECPSIDLQEFAKWPNFPHLKQVRGCGGACGCPLP